MITTDDVVRNLMNYFAAIEANTHRKYSIRDFDTQVMMNAYSPEERECLGLALDVLAAAGMVQSASPTDYLLTEKGVAGVRALRRSRQ